MSALSFRTFTEGDEDIGAEALAPVDSARQMAPRLRLRGMNKALVLLLLGCGSASMPPPGGTGGGGTSSNGNGGTCCLNGSFYQCDSKAAFDKCAGFDVGACNDACSASDFMCHQTCF